VGQLPDLMTVAEVAAAFRVSDETIHRWCRQERLEFVDVLGNKRFRREYIESIVGAEPVEAAS